MLFMTILTWKPEQRADIIQRRVEIGQFPQEGVKVLGEWNDLQGGRYFRVSEVQDASDLLAAAMAVNDICDVETIPVLGTEEVMDIIQK